MQIYINNFKQLKKIIYQTVLVLVCSWSVRITLALNDSWVYHSQQGFFCIILLVHFADNETTFSAQDVFLLCGITTFICIKDLWITPRIKKKRSYHIEGLETNFWSVLHWLSAGKGWLLGESAIPLFYHMVWNINRLVE